MSSKKITVVPSTVPLPKQKVSSIPRFVSPPSVPFCTLWLDASDTSTLSLSSSTVTRWNDKSGNANKAVSYNGTVSTGSNINGLNALYFPAQAQLVLQTSASSSTFTTGTNITCFIVAQRTQALPGSSGAGYFFITTDNFSANAVGPNWSYYSVTTVSANPYMAYKMNLTEYDCFNVIRSPTSAGVFCLQPQLNLGTVDGTTYAGNGAASLPEGSYNTCLGGVRGDSYAFKLGEVIIFNSSLSSSQRQTVEAYLAQKWGTTATLQAGHPGLSAVYYSGYVPPTIPKLKLKYIPYPTKPPIFAFTSFTSGNLTIGGNTSLNGSVYQLTPNAGSQTGVAYYPTKLNITSFTSYFVIQFANTQADGATFIIQNSSATAQGGTGGGLGYLGITPSVAIRLDTYNGSTDTGPGIFSTEIMTNGTLTNDLAASGKLNTTLGLTAAGTSWNFGVAVTYNGTTLSYTITNLDIPSKTYTYSGAVNIASVVGASTAWVGFTSATGGATETCSLSQWNFYN